MVIRKIKLPDGNTYDLPGASSGDMEKSTYDTNDDGIVNESDVADTVKFGQYNIEFGIDGSGNYGYIKHGESTITPFGDGGGGGGAYVVDVTALSPLLYGKPIMAIKNGSVVKTETLSSKGKATILLTQPGTYTFTVTY